MGRRARFSFLLCLILALVGCDRATKTAARGALVSSGPMALVPGMLELRYVENRDSAFSLTQHIGPHVKTPLLALGSVVGLTALAAFGWRIRKRALLSDRIALSLVAAGAIGNSLDRLRSGYVVDFIHLEHWPVFNVADALIVVGIFVLLVNGRARALSRAPPGSPT
jgi:signal peptidase II